MPQRFGFAASSWRHYEAVIDFPQGLIPIGDSICRFKPVYAQGMSVAAREAAVLADLLARRARGAGDVVGLPQNFLAECQPWIAGAWSMSTAPDLAYPQTCGERPADLATCSTAQPPCFGSGRVTLGSTTSWSRSSPRTAGDVLREPGLVDRVRAEMAAHRLRQLSWRRQRPDLPGRRAQAARR